MEGTLLRLAVPDYQGLLIDSRSLSLVSPSLHFTTPPVELIYQADGVAWRACQSQRFLRHPSERTRGTMIGRPRRHATRRHNKCALQGDDEIQLRFEPFEVSSWCRTVEECLVGAARTLAARSAAPLTALTASSAQLTDYFTCSPLISRVS
jgi:hypothetical protein